MRMIPLTLGLFALVDDADFEAYNRHKWCAKRNKNTFYAARYAPRPGGGYTHILMHREILGLTDRKIQGDHRDGNGLNNQRSNLRVATQAQNCAAFQTPHKNKTSQFRGVCWDRRQKKWRAYLQSNGKLSYLGLFFNESEAARAYDTAAIEKSGEFAQLNFPSTPHANREERIQKVLATYSQSY